MKKSNVNTIAYPSYNTSNLDINYVNALLMKKPTPRYLDYYENLEPLYKNVYPGIIDALNL